MAKRLYTANNPEPFPLSRTKIDLSVECSRCFYLDVKLGIGRPSGPPYLLNSAVDVLFKKEFDQYRVMQKPHPLMDTLREGLVPVERPDLETWRYNFKGVRFLHQETNFILFGAIDDLWYDTINDIYIVVDYKSTSKKDDVAVNNVYPGYWRQLEFYQYLVAKQGLEVTNQGVLVYANAKKTLPEFGGHLLFDVRLVHDRLNNKWVENAVLSAWNVLNSDTVPNFNSECKFCSYAETNAARTPDLIQQTQSQFSLPF
tara:strand:+ start:3583 stop:4353 length:771 start_codon:yes stop_codon:yes gene_type:complete